MYLLRNQLLLTMYCFFASIFVASQCFWWTEATRTDCKNSTQEIHSLNSTTLKQVIDGIYRNIKDQIQAFERKPVVHDYGLPIFLGFLSALTTFLLICLVRRCLRNREKYQRKLQIKNLMQSLKTGESGGPTQLVQDDSDNEAL